MSAGSSGVGMEEANDRYNSCSFRPEAGTKNTSFCTQSEDSEPLRGEAEPLDARKMGDKSAFSP